MARHLAFAALAVLLIAAAVDTLFGIDVEYVMEPLDPDAVAAGFVPGDDPARRYGVPVPGGTERVLLADRSGVVRPPEAPDRALWILRPLGERPRSARALWVVALGLSVALLVARGALRAVGGAGRRGP